MIGSWPGSSLPTTNSRLNANAPAATISRGIHRGRARGPPPAEHGAAPVPARPSRVSTNDRPSALLVAHAAMVPHRSRLSVLRCISILLGPALVHSEECHDILPPESFSEGERKKFPYDRGSRCGQLDRSPELNGKSEVLLA